MSVAESPVCDVEPPQDGLVCNVFEEVALPEPFDASAVSEVVLEPPSLHSVESARRRQSELHISGQMQQMRRRRADAAGSSNSSSEKAANFRSTFVSVCFVSVRVVSVAFSTRTTRAVC
jgi:hypothetical protein